MGKVIVITSGKGGVGKTVTTANIGASLALEGKKVVVIDADIGLRNLDLVMGLENRIVFDIVDVIEKKCRSYRQALIRDKRFKSLFLLPSSQSREKDSVSPNQMVDLCDTLREHFDFVLIDCPAGIEQGFKNAIIGSDESIIVTNPEVSSVRDADRVIGLLEAEEKSEHWLLVNRMNDGLVKRKKMLSVEDITEVLGIDVIGIVPEDENVLFSTNKGIPLVLEKNSLAGVSYRNIARKLIDPNCTQEIEIRDDGFWAKLKRLFLGDRSFGYKAR
ncbi:MAG: septum site-determining protein MinD [Candidatus Eremiobacteraeota bacterium]|nr:septum site-determining protein MinD [Candidatus Eremiobacteraeota bacterium]